MHQVSPELRVTSYEFCHLSVIIRSQWKLSQWSQSEFSKIPRSCYEKSQDWTKIFKLYWKYQKTVKMRTLIFTNIEKLRNISYVGYIVTLCYAGFTLEMHAPCMQASSEGRRAWRVDLAGLPGHRRSRCRRLQIPVCISAARRTTSLENRHVHIYVPGCSYWPVTWQWCLTL